MNLSQEVKEIENKIMQIGSEIAKTENSIENNKQGKEILE
jgi:hypothetical protein